MATTWIKPLHISKTKSKSTAISDIIDYVENPEKTDNGRLITAYCCNSKEADEIFIESKKRYYELTGRDQRQRDVYYEYSTLREIAVPPSSQVPSPKPIDEQVDELQGIDFDALRSINPDVIGWIEVYGSDISYPIVQAQDNAKYINHTFSGEQNRSGAIFLDHRDNSRLLSLARVYGHNMRDRSMFGKLADWQGDTIIIYTPYARLEYSVTERSVVLESQVQRLAEEFDGLALITCVTNRRSFRYVVLAERIISD